mgnify:CR=1 FL=1
MYVHQDEIEGAVRRDIDADGAAAWDRNEVMIKRIARVDTLERVTEFPKGTVSLALPASGHTVCTVYDAAGNRVAELLRGYLDRGSHAVTWDATGMPAGSYFVEAAVGSRASALRLVKTR